MVEKRGYLVIVFIHAASELMAYATILLLKLQISQPAFPSSSLHSLAFEAEQFVIACWPCPSSMSATVLGTVVG